MNKSFKNIVGEASAFLMLVCLIGVFISLFGVIWSDNQIIFMRLSSTFLLSFILLLPLLLL